MPILLAIPGVVVCIVFDPAESADAIIGGFALAGLFLGGLIGIYCPKGWHEGCKKMLDDY
jgi:hypothetical protein